jgi:hypothetical protein
MANSKFKKGDFIEFPYMGESVFGCFYGIEDETQVFGESFNYLNSNLVMMNTNISNLDKAKKIDRKRFLMVSNHPQELTKTALRLLKKTMDVKILIVELNDLKYGKQI